MAQAPETDHRIQAILASGIKIPPMPDKLIRLNALLRDPDAGPAELAALLRDDGALSGAIFRVVGSPVFGLRAKVDSLPRAIALLGMKNTAALLHSEVLRAAMSDPQHARALEHLWHRGTALAEVCVAIVKKAHLRDIGPDTAFLLGMFHDCGLALLCKRFPVYATALSGEVWPDITELDRTNQISHAVMGQMVAKNWLLPDDLVLAIRHHHEPDNLSESTRRLCAVLDFASHLHQRRLACDNPAWQAEQLAEMLRVSVADVADLETEILVEA